VSHAPFSSHLRDAIAINRARTEPWAALSAGRSRLISRALIASEYATLPVAWWFEWHARSAGLDAVATLGRCFVEMRDLPPVTHATPRDAPHDVRRRRGADTSMWRGAVAAAQRADRADAAVAASRALLEPLDDAPGTLCMRRHLAESAARVASVLRLPETPREVRPVLWALLLRHALGLTAADRLDDLALPLQRDGIPILAHDLPVIPLVHTERT
jgi:hypothetical protein